MTTPQTLCVCCNKHPVPWHQLLCGDCVKTGEALCLITPVPQEPHPCADPRIHIGPTDV